MSVKGLSVEESNRLKVAVRNRESGGDYQQPGNQFGYIGGYQFGAAALESVGLLKPGASKQGNSAINNPSNWTIDGGKDAFLNNPALQDRSFEKLANQNISVLEKKGIISGDTSAGDIAGFASAAHLKGAGGAIDLANGRITADANGTKTSEYFGLGKGAVTGASLGPSLANSSTIGKAITLSGEPPSSSLPPFTGQTGIGNVIQVDGIEAIGSEATAPKGPIINPLEQFSSFNSIFTLSCLDNKRINFPDAADSYKKGDLGQIVLRSGGGNPDNRVKTAFTSDANPTGKFEYYIDNVEIDSIISFNKKTKGSNSTNITFEVFEPYSMGIFLQSLQIAAKESKYSNYLEAPFLLTIQFIGYDSAGNPVPVNDVLDRHIPLKLSNVTMDVTASGCKYNVDAYPWNEQALTDMNNLLKEDMSIAGKDVVEILQTGKNSLQYWVNTKLQEIAKTAEDNGKSKATPDEIVIIFPKVKDSASSQIGNKVSDTAAPLTKSIQTVSKNNAVESKLTLTRGSNALLVQETATLNEIGSSSLGFSAVTGSESVAPEDNKAQPDAAKPVKRVSNFYDTQRKSFRFSQGTSIVEAITEVILMSDYCKNSADGPSDKRGMKKWFRVETQVYNLESTTVNEGKGSIPKLLVFKVVPYYVHEYRISAPTATPKGYDQLKKEVAKEYNYIYTGKNVDILNFNIRLEAAFYTTMYADKNALSGATYQQNKGTGVERSGAPNEKLNQSNSQDSGVGLPSQGSYSSRDNKVGPMDNYRTLIAKNFQEALLNSPTDMITAELEIMGDPYYIADSGMGNFSDRPSNFNTNSNGSMNYQSGEVDILINFRTPVDYNPETGFVDFGSSEKVEGFSGLYQVLTVKNKFNSGKFIQTLDLVRRRTQEPKQQQSMTSITGALQSSVTGVTGAVTGVVSNVQSTVANTVNTATGTVKEIVNTSTGAIQGVVTAVTNPLTFVDTDSAKKLAVNPNQEEKTALDSTGKGSTTDQIDFGLSNLIPGFFQ